MRWVGALTMWAVACGGGGTKPVDAMADAFTCPFESTDTPVAVYCAGTTNVHPAECVAASDVNWIVLPTNTCVPMASAPLPAGYFMDDPMTGCFWVIVRPDAIAGYTVEASSHGCGWSLGVPEGFACDACGHCMVAGTDCQAFWIDTEACRSGGRTSSDSGRMRLTIDPVGSTLTITGPVFDTSSSPSGCGICP